MIQSISNSSILMHFVVLDFKTLFPVFHLTPAVLGGMVDLGKILNF